MIPLAHTSESPAAVRGTLTYRLGDYSFSFDYARVIVPSQITFPAGVAALCFGHLEVDMHLWDGQWMGVSGLTNYQTWIRCPLSVPGPVRTCGLLSDEFAGMQSGVGYTVDDVQFENRYFDPQSGWFCTGDRTAPIDAFVQFASNCYASLRDGRVVAIWLHPENWRSIVSALEAT